jgi:CheY-like chemotaxis protein
VINVTTELVSLARSSSSEDGYAFERRVRAADDVMLRNLPLVAMTAYARAEDRHRVLAAGFQRHVAKPIEPADPARDKSLLFSVRSPEEA